MLNPPSRLLHEGLQRSAQATPDKVAAIVEGSEHSYADLDEQSTRLARGLAARGVGRGDRVAVYMDNTWPCVVAIFAISKVSAVFLVINPQTKQDKLAYVLDDSGAKILLTDGHLQGVFKPIIAARQSLRAVICSGVLPDQASGQLAIEAFDRVLSESAADDIPSLTIPTDLCALIYTSGSTGNPKGVMHTHQSMVFSIGSLTQYLRLSAQDRMLNLLPMAFDYGLYQLLMSVWLGATLILERSFTYPAQILNRIKEYQVTVFPGVPTIYTMLLAAHSRKPLCLPSVTRVTNTAAALSPQLLPKLKEIFPSALIYKMYGLTECKRVCYLEPELIDTHPSSVGKAMPGTEVFLRSADGLAVAPGEEGVLHVRGPHLMSGYWRQPELSQQMLKEAEIPGEYVLCTHDWFRMDEEGLLYFIGRKDDIIKTRGEKVSPVEVEHALESIDGIHEVAVIGVADELLGQAIKAYIALDKDSDLHERKIRKICMTKLENFMVPKDIVILPALPKSPNGKIDKKQLITNEE